VSGPRIQLISEGRRLPFFGPPALASADHPWDGFAFEEAVSPAVSVPRHHWPRTTLFLCTAGHGTNHWKHRGVWSADRVRPGAVFIARAGSEIQERWAREEWSCMVLSLDNARLAELAPEQVSAIDSSLVSALATNDDRLAALMQTLRAEVRAGCVSGKIYAEAISLALLAYIAGRYATPPSLEGREPGLSATEKRRLVDYVRDNLANNISVTELGALIQMRPSHFTRLFKLSFGVTPYQFVMQERIEGAKLMLTAKCRSSEVAAAYGFASQSHFVKVFRQFTGVTPKRFGSGV